MPESLFRAKIFCSAKNVRNSFRALILSYKINKSQREFLHLLSICRGLAWSFNERLNNLYWQNELCILFKGLNRPTLFPLFHDGAHKASVQEQMKRFRFLLVYVFGFASLGFSQQGGGAPGRSSEDDSNAIAEKESPKATASYSTGIALAASLVFPGGGQIYTRHYVKAGLFIAAEVGVGLFGYQRYVQASWLRHNADSIASVAALHRNWVRVPGDSTASDTAFLRKLEADSADMERKVVQNVWFQSLAWMAGIYYYNV